MSELNLVIYDVISLDVWGNEKDGFEINNAYHTGRTVALPVNPTLDQTLRALRAAGEFDRTAHRRTIAWSPEVEHGSEDLTVIRRKTGKPLLTLSPQRPKSTGTMVKWPGGIGC